MEGLLVRERVLLDNDSVCTVPRATTVTTPATEAFPLLPVIVGVVVGALVIGILIVVCIIVSLCW